jgi:hypothetical protein
VPPAIFILKENIMGSSHLIRRIKPWLEDKLGYPCEVWYSRKHPQGWMFKTDKTPTQRLGYNALEALHFIRTFNWKPIKKELQT